jgi:hypothetical protein
MKIPDVLRFGCVSRRLVAAAALAILAACADPANHWHKDGVAESQRDRDYAACRDLSRGTAATGVDQDLAASRAGTNHTPGGTDTLPTDVDSGATRAAGEAMIACMTDHGYHGD